MCLQSDVFAIIGRGLYAEVDPGRFGNLGVACYTLFQLMTLDDWFYMYSEVAEKHPGEVYMGVTFLGPQSCHTYVYTHITTAQKPVYIFQEAIHPMLAIASTVPGP